MPDPDRNSPAPRLARRELLRLAAAAGVTLALPCGTALASTAPLLARPIPRSGERLPVIGLGTAIVFDIADDAAARAERRTVVNLLVEGGASIIDTAPSYGAAESVVGDLVAELGVRNRVFLSTKFRRAGRDGAVTEMKQSLARLRTERVDVMLRHNVGFVERAAADEHFAVLREWKQQGTCRYIGATHSQRQPEANARLIEVMQQEKLDFLQINYSLVERSVEERLLGVARDTGTAIMVNLPFGRGRLFRAVRGRKLPEWAADFDASSWGQLFLKYILADEAVNCVLPGTDKPHYMTDNLGAGRGRLPTAAQRRRIVEFVDSLG